MAIEKVNGLAVVSGKGGVGRSVISLNLALAIGKMGVKTVLFDASGGDLTNLANAGQWTSVVKTESTSQLAENVYLYNSALVNPYLVTSSKQIRRLLQEIINIVPGFKCAIFDCPTGINAISQTLAGLSEKIVLVSTPDPTAIAGAYIVAKAFARENLGERIGLLFNLVESIDDAASLKTRFDLMSGTFLNCRFADYGHIRKDAAMADSVMEQNPLFNYASQSPAAVDVAALAQKMYPSGLFQYTSRVPKTNLAIGK
jgi:flagellar biosynthesis protein FlhG